MRHYLAAFCAVALALGAFFYVSFFSVVRSTLSEATGKEFIWPYQLYYNFCHGHAYQSSLSATDTEVPGMKHNPYAYISANAHHFNVTPYVLALPWSLHPTPTFLHFLFIIWNVIAGIIFTLEIMKRRTAKAAFAISVFLCGGSLGVFSMRAQFLLFAGPFLFAAYYYLTAGNKAAFLAAIIGLCLVTEEAAMVALAFCAFIALFEPRRRSFARAGAAFALPYLLLVLLVIQPAARIGLDLSEGTTTLAYLKGTALLTPARLLGNLRSWQPLFPLLAAFPLAGLLFGPPEKKEAVSSAALALLPALPLWGVCLVYGGGHHLLPPFVFTFLALLRLLVGAKPSGPFRPRAVAIAMAAFFLVTLRVHANFLPNALRVKLYRAAGQREKARALEAGLRFGAESNRAVIRAAQAVPPEKGLVYWVNNSVMGFVSGRTNVWQFPDYFDQADFLLIQKDAYDLRFVFDLEKDGDVKQALARTGSYDNVNVAMRSEVVNRVVEALVRKARTHKIASEDEHALLLENLSPRPLPSREGGTAWPIGSN